MAKRLTPALAQALTLTLGLAAPLSSQSDPGSVPRPATENMEPQVVEALDAAWRSLAELLHPSAEESTGERAAAVGEACEVFHAHGSVEPAIACYRLATELDPESARWPYLLGSMLKNQGHSAESLNSLRASEALRSDPFTRLRIGEVLAAEGRLDEATQMLVPLLNLDAVRVSASAELGKIALLNGDAATAIERLEAALVDQPEALSLHFSLAQAHRSLGADEAAKHHAALAGQRQVRVADPILQQVGERSVSSETYVNMGAQALRTGDRETAIAAYSKALQLNPDNQRAWMNLGTIALEAGRLNEAEEHLRRALTLDPGYGFAHFNLAEVLQRRQEPQRALEHYRAAVDANPANVEFGIACGDAAMRTGEFEAAANQYQRITNLAPEFARPHYLRALALVALERFDEAAEAAAAAHDLAADDEDITRAYIRLASTATGVSEKRRDEARRVAQRLFEKYRSTDEGELLAMALAANGEFDQAVRIQTQVVQALQSAGVNAAVVHFLEANLDAYREGRKAEQPWARAADAAQ